MHMPFSDMNLRDVEVLVDTWRAKGFIGSLDTQTSSRGFVTVATPNWLTNDGAYVRIELHKVSAGKGFFGGQKSRWVTRLLTSPSKESKDVSVHGCFESVTQVHAFDRAIRDVGTFLSKSRLEDYLSD